MSNFCREEPGQSGTRKRVITTHAQCSILHIGYYLDLNIKGLYLDNDSKHVSIYLHQYYQVIIQCKQKGE